MRLTDKNFEEEVLKSDIPVLVEFWASWCPPCKMMEPILRKLEIKYKGRVKIGTLNVDLNPRTAAKYNITGVPHLHTYLEMGKRYTGMWPPNPRNN